MKNILIIIGLMVFSISCSDDEVVVKCSAEGDSATAAGALLTGAMGMMESAWADLPDNALTDCAASSSDCYDDLAIFITLFTNALTQAASSCASAEAYLDCWTTEGLTADEAGNDRAYYVTYFNTLLTYDLLEDFTQAEIDEVGVILEIMGAVDPGQTLECSDFSITID